MFQSKSEICLIQFEKIYFIKSEKDLFKDLQKVYILLQICKKYVVKDFERIKFKAISI